MHSVLYDNKIPALTDTGWKIKITKNATERPYKASIRFRHICGFISGPDSQPSPFQVLGVASADTGSVVCSFCGDALPKELNEIYWRSVLNVPFPISVTRL